MKTYTGNYAERELSILFQTVKDSLIKDFKEEILILCEKFGNSGQSGGSAPYTANVLSQVIKKLCLQEPICDITGIDEEWVDVAERAGKPMFQNNRCSAIFKEGEDGQAYYLDAIVWKTQTGSCWTGNAFLSNGEKINSKQFIKKFPFKPKTFYIDVIEKEVAKDDWEFYLKDEKQLKRVFKYYNRYAL